MMELRLIITCYLNLLVLFLTGHLLLSFYKSKPAQISATQFHSHSTTQYNSGSFILYFTDDNSSISTIYMIAILGNGAQSMFPRIVTF